MLRLIAIAIDDPDVRFGNDNQAVDLGLRIRRILEAKVFVADAPDFLDLCIETIRCNPLAGEPVFDVEHAAVGGLRGERQEQEKQGGKESWHGRMVFSEILTEVYNGSPDDIRYGLSCLGDGVDCCRPACSSGRSPGNSGRSGRV